ADAAWWQVSKFDTAVITDASQVGVRVRKLDVVAMRTLSLRGSRACYRLMREGKDVAQQYRDAMPELTSRENWTRLFQES
ncbi:MAG: glycosyltransferase family 2 protein, partial [Mycobacteriaceae bacterium]